MFCEKCGNKINDGEKFCMRCGNPVSAPVQPKAEPSVPQQTAPAQQAAEPSVPQQTAPAQQAAEPSVPQQTAPAQQAAEPSVPQQTAPVQPKAESAAPQQTAPVQQAAEPVPAQPKEKKGLPKGAKLGIIFGSIGVAVIALILVLVFAVIVPLLTPKVDMSKYVTMEFDSNSETVYDGNISGKICFDMDKLKQDYPKQFNKVGASFVDDVLYNAKITYSVQDSDIDDYGYKYVYFDSAKKDDVYVVTVTWPEDPVSKASIEKNEKTIGFKFIKDSKTVELKVGDVVTQKGFDVKDTVDLDVLGYIKDNNLIYVQPSSYNNDISVYVKEFETEINGLTVRKDSYYDSYVSVYDSSSKFVATVYIGFDKSYNLSDGDTVTLDYDSYNGDAKSNGLVLIGEPISYTVEAPEMLTKVSAKQNADAIKTYFVNNAGELDSKVNTGDVIEVKEAYYIEDKDYPDTAKIVIVYFNKTQNYYKTVELSIDGWFIDGEFVFDGYSYTNSSANTIEKAKESCYYLDSKYYTATKLG